MFNAMEIVPVINDHEHCAKAGECWMSELHVQSAGPCPALNLPEGARRMTDGDGNPKVEPVTCGHCGRMWDEAVITSLTPAPSGRCPFEYEHIYEGEDED